MLKKVIPLVVLTVAAVVIWMFHDSLILLITNSDVLRVQLVALGWWGPLVLILLSVVQVLVAPLPGYPIVLVAGVLYGTFWGALYANAGIVISGLVAMGITRLYGRPLAEKFVETGRLKRIERLLESDSIWLWFLIMLFPTGDYPYFAAGLSRVSLKNFLIALCLARLPFTFLLTYAAERTTTLPSELTWLFGAVLVALLVLAYWQQARIMRWGEFLLDKVVPPHPSESET